MNSNQKDTESISIAGKQSGRTVSLVPSRRMLICFLLVLPILATGPLLSTEWKIFALLLFAILCVVDAMIAGNRSVPVEVELPTIVRLSREVPGNIPLHIRNDSEKQMTLKIGISLPSYLEVPSSEKLISLSDVRWSEVLWECIPRKRGKYVVDRYHLEVDSPLGLWNVRRSYPLASEIRVYSDLSREWKKVQSRFWNRRETGIHPRRFLGQGREFEKLREYMPGDGFDQIHWKTTAKRGKPITKVFQTERTQEIYVVVDFSRRIAREVGNETVLEKFLRSGLLLGNIAQQQGDLFGVLTFSNQVETFLRAAAGKSHYAACRDALLTIQPRLVAPDFEELFSMIRTRLRRRALLMVLTDLNDPVLAESFWRSAMLVVRQHLLLVNMIRPEGVQPLFVQAVQNTADLYESLGNHILWKNLSELKNTLHRYGIQLNLVDTPELTGRLISEYVQVKERQLL